MAKQGSGGTKKRLVVPPKDWRTHVYRVLEKNRMKEKSVNVRGTLKKDNALKSKEITKKTHKE